MELEQLKKSWYKLSERLEREEVIHRQELKLVVENKITTYFNRIKMNQYLGWLVLICAIGLLFVQNIQDDPFGWIAIGSVIVLDVVFFSPMWRIIKRLAKFDTSITEQEKMILKFEKLYVRNSIVGACYFATIFAYVIIEAMVKHAVLSSEWWLWMILTIIASAIMGGWRYISERDRIIDIKQRITALKQFEE